MDYVVRAAWDKGHEVETCPVEVYVERRDVEGRGADFFAVYRNEADGRQTWISDHASARFAVVVAARLNGAAR